MMSSTAGDADPGCPSAPLRYGAKFAHDPCRRQVRLGAGLLPSSRLHQLFLACIGAPFAVIAVPIIAVCQAVVLLGFRAKRKSAAVNVSVEAGSSTANAVLQARTMYHRFGFGPDYLAPVLAAQRRAFPTALAHAAFVLERAVVEWFFWAFRVDLLSSLYRMVMADGMVPPSDLGTALQARTCWIDDVVETFLDEEAGLGSSKQVVILGSGFDTRCYRFACPPQGHTEQTAALGGTSGTGKHKRRKVTWFEVDSGASQRVKQMVLAEAKIDFSHVHFVDADFNVPNAWIDALVREGLDPAVETLLVWEGVTMYLTREAVEQTLRGVQNAFARGSRIALSYITSEYASHPKSSALVKAIGEPWLFSLPSPGLLAPQEADGPVRKLIEEQGLALVEHFWDLDEAKSYYLPTLPNGSLVGFGWRETSGGLCLAAVR